MKKLKSLFIFTGLVESGLCLFAGNKINKQSDEKPNVIIIYADDLGYGDVKCYGGKNIETPNIDRLAKEGIRFTDVHAVAATSTPSRYSLLTGEYAWRKQNTDIAAGNAGMIISPYQFTIADMFRSCGYKTGVVGKWHLGLGEKGGEQDWNAPLTCGPGDLGFDYSYIMAATADRVPCVFIEKECVANYDETAPIYVSYNKNFDGEPTGKSNPELLFNLKSSHGHNMSIVNGIGRIGFMKGGGRALWKDENIADSIACKSVKFIKENAGTPFFLYCATNDIHVPRFPHERFRGKNKMGLRGDAIAQLDWTVGEILRTLDSLKIADNTIILFSSDNGPVTDDGYADKAEELLNGHSPAGVHRGGKYSAYEGGTIVPAIIRWPKKIKGGTISDALMSQIDWFKSFAALTGAKIPEGAAADSRNACDNLFGKSSKGRDWIAEYSLDHSISIRTKEWKYIPPRNGPKMVTFGPKIETGNSPEVQLYRMSRDQSEKNNVAEEYPHLVKKLGNIADSLEVFKKKQ